MINPEPIATALLELLQGIESLSHVTRWRLGAEQIPSYPAAIVAMSGATVQASHGLPSQWTMTFEIGFLDRADGNEETPETKLNAWLVELQSKLAPAEGEETLTLGGVCEHAWISGEVEYVPPNSQYPVMECWVQVEVLAVG